MNGIWKGWEEKEAGKELSHHPSRILIQVVGRKVKVERKEWHPILSKEDE